MSKLLSVKDRVLLGLAFLGDVLDEARLVGGLVSVKYQNLYGWVPPQYCKNDFYKAVSDLFKTQDIEKRTKKGEVCLVLTNQGRKRLVRRFPVVKFAQTKWDGMFTQVVFDIEEVARTIRDSLRQWLLALTFGRLQKSVYITPHNIAQDVAEFIEAHLLVREAKVFRSRLVMGDPKKLAEKVWKISRLNRKYQKLFEAWEKGKGLTGKDREELNRKLKSAFAEIVTIDPFLPKELLPNDWIGGEARRIIQSMK